MGGSLDVDQRVGGQHLRAGEDPGAMLLPLVRSSGDQAGARDHEVPRRPTMGGPGPQHSQLELLVRPAGIPREAGGNGEPGEEKRLETSLIQRSKTNPFFHEEGSPRRKRAKNSLHGLVRSQIDKEETLDEWLGKNTEIQQMDSPEGKAIEVVKDEEQREEGGKKEVEGGDEPGGDTPSTPTFPPCPPSPLLQKEEEQAWSLASLIRLDWLRSPRKGPKEDPSLRGDKPLRTRTMGTTHFQLDGQSGPRETKPSAGRRKDLQPGQQRNRKSNTHLGLRRNATKAAAKGIGRKHSIEKEFFSKNGEAPRISRRNTIKKILEAAGDFKGGRLTVETMKTLASALKEAGYKSGLNYLIELKMWHLEEGGLWDSQLDRTFKLCKRGLERGKGPTRKAPEVPKERREFTKELLVRATTCKVKFPHLLFVFGMVWMLREIEIAALSTEDIVVDYVGKKVTLVWQFSKKDQEALGMKRTLQCLCGQLCSGECPFWVSTQLVNAVEKFNGTNSAIALTRSRVTPSKDMIVKSWTRTFGMPVGGHSARRTGALSYIRAGWDVGQVAYLGRWSSNIILEYAKEALEEVPVNLRTPKMVEGFYPAKRLASEDSLQSLMDTQAKTQMEVKRMKSDFKAVKEKVEDTVEQLEKWAETGDNLPERVQSTHSKVVHANMATLAVSPPFSWRTKCGWHYHFSHYVFVKSNVEVTCAKCKAAQ